MFDYGIPEEVEYARRCSKCKGQLRGEDRTGTPKEYHDADLTKFDFGIYSHDMGKMQDLCHNFLDHFQKWEMAGKGLYLWSRTPGSGKTFLACCLAKSVMMKYNLSMRFITAPDYIDAVGNSYKRERGEEDPSQIYRECGILVLDDIGAQADKDWHRQEIFRLVNKRMEDGNITIYTSNMSTDTLNVDNRTRDRIIKTSIELRMPEESIRKKEAAREQKTFLAMNDKFSKDGNSPILDDKYKDFNKSQLQEMLYLTDDQIEEAEPEMSAKEIRAIRKPPEVEVIAPAQQEEQIPGQDSIERHPEYMPRKMTIETATGQNRPPENEIPITPELQIERFFEALNRGDKERVLTCEINAITYLLEARYQDVRIRNGNFNYQANSTGIMFNPGSYMECAFTWNELAHELIKRFGKKRKPVKMTSVDTPEKPKKKDNEVSGPAKCITGKSKSGICGAAAYCGTEYNCCAQCPDDCKPSCVQSCKRHL